MAKRIKFKAWKGDFYDSYFNNLENGEWVNVNIIRFIFLKIRNFRTKIIIE